MTHKVINALILLNCDAGNVIRQCYIGETIAGVLQVSQREVCHFRLKLPNSTD